MSLFQERLDNGEHVQKLGLAKQKLQEMCWSSRFCIAGY